MQLAVQLREKNKLKKWRRWEEGHARSGSRSPVRLCSVSSFHPVLPPARLGYDYVTRNSLPGDSILRPGDADWWKTLGVRYRLSRFFRSVYLFRSFIPNAHRFPPTPSLVDKSTNHCLGITIHEPIRSIPQGRGPPRAPAAGAAMLEADDQS